MVAWIENACNSYRKTSSESIPLYDAVKDKAWVSGGYDHSVPITPDQKFITKFFQVMTDYSRPQGPILLFL